MYNGRLQVSYFLSDVSSHAEVRVLVDSIGDQHVDVFLRTEEVWKA